MKRIIISSLLLFAVAFTVQAQYGYPKFMLPEKSKKEIKKWVKQGSWRNGFQAATPDKHVDLEQFYEQCHKNPTQWAALFQWLAKTDLLTIPKGKYPIAGTTLVASVEDSSNQPLEKRGSESHYKHIDFQYVVKGTEGFALLDHPSSVANCLYDAKKDVIHYDFNKDKTVFFNSTPGKFLIFFPSDWHIAKVQTNKKDQNLRVIVIKVDYID